MAVTRELLLEECDKATDHFNQHLSYMRRLCGLLLESSDPNVKMKGGELSYVLAHYHRVSARVVSDVREHLITHH